MNLTIAVLIVFSAASIVFDILVMNYLNKVVTVHDVQKIVDLFYGDFDVIKKRLEVDENRLESSLNEISQLSQKNVSINLERAHDMEMNIQELFRGIRGLEEFRTEIKETVDQLQKELEEKKEIKVQTEQVAPTEIKPRKRSKKSKTVEEPQMEAAAVGAEVE